MNSISAELDSVWHRIFYHVWWPSSGDPYYDWNQSPVINREAYYDVGYVPHMYTNGNVDSAGTAATWRTNARAAVNQPTVFKIDIKSKNLLKNIINGGRYDGLISDLGLKKQTPAVGAAINLNL